VRRAARTSAAVVITFPASPGSSTPTIACPSGERRRAACRSSFAQSPRGCARASPTDAPRRAAPCACPAPSSSTSRGSAPRRRAATRDLSRTGIGLVAPAVRIGERYLTDSPLRLVLEHPTGPLELTAAPVRYERLEDDGGEERGYVIGLRITSMSDADRARYERHLNQLR
jgi:hypothetical protein